MKVLCLESYRGSRVYSADVIGIKDDMYFVMDGSTAVLDDYNFFLDGDLFCYMQKIKEWR